MAQVGNPTNRVGEPGMDVAFSHYPKQKTGKSSGK